jgi:uncharacterized DUF497 family protein
MHILLEYDARKRYKTLVERGLDLARASEIFECAHFTAEDDRADYQEARFITVGRLDGYMVVTVWTHRGEARRIISMRKANDREKAKYNGRLG